MKSGAFKSLALVFFVFSMVCFATAAQAEPKPWIWSWWPSHWEGLDFEPYIDDAKHPHNSEWNASEWQPGDWIVQRPDQLHLVRGFYRADILRDQFEDDDIPVLQVGPGFYRLGGQDQRRVARTVDEIYGITARHKSGIYMLEDWRTKQTIGLYTSHGLQLQ